MARPLRVYVGWDQRDIAAFIVCQESLHAHASIPIEVVPLRDWELRRRGVYWREYHVDQRGQMWDSRDGKPFSTAFAFTRFLVPLLEDYGKDPVVFCDADMLWRADVAELVELSKGKPLACVQHDYRPPESEKMEGVIQTRYDRKNWSSLMVMRPHRCKGLTPYVCNNWSGQALHGMSWIDDQDIGALPERWNWLEGWSEGDDPAVVHYTRGTPDMEGCEGAAYADEWWGYLNGVQADACRTAAA